MTLSRPLVKLFLMHHQLRDDILWEKRNRACKALDYKQLLNIECKIVTNRLKTVESKKQGLKGHPKETRDVKIMEYKNRLYSTISRKFEIKIKVDFTSTTLPLTFPLQANILTDLAGVFVVVAF